MIGTIISRIVGTDLFEAEWRNLGGAHLQATVERVGARAIVVLAFAYHNSPGFAHWFDGVVSAITGGG